MPNPQGPDKPKVFLALNFGWTSAVGFFICIFVGYWADQKFGTGFLFTLIGIVLGIFMLFYEVWKILKELNDDNKNQK